MMASQTIKEKIVELQKSKQTPQNSRPKIQRVPHYLRNRNNFEKHYTPNLVSIGPIHHDNANLKLGEKYKLMWAAEYIENSGFILEDLHKKIADNIDELKGHFSDNVLTLTGKSLEGFGSLEEKLSWMLFVDGCSLLHILEKVGRDDSGKMNVNQLSLVKVDVVLLENQLPYELLKLLWKDNESELIKSMTNFFKYNHWAQTSEKEKDMGPNIKGEGEHSVSITNESQSETPFHLLDHLHKLNLTTSKYKNQSNEAESREFSQKKNESKSITYRGIEDLRAVGIKFEANFGPKPTDIALIERWFSWKLSIPRIPVNNFTAALFLNMVAYEMCPDFDNDYEICSYVAFMDSLIDHPEDVKELRSKGILCTVWSDEEVVSLFNINGTDLVTNVVNRMEVHVMRLRDHYFTKYKTWISLGFRTYFNNPCAVIAFLTAFIALALTFIQTWFTVHPASK